MDIQIKQFQALSPRIAIKILNSDEVQLWSIFSSSAIAVVVILVGK
ncbi:hypothetical protein [Gloeocapsa sp. PCC 73106]|nr:hypothetical protein [Gloeocapsa sp. PCC 73106]ELR97550.1 hypothetical protein GLO73106DRAFT_00013600 [Gloeocapsa sp. PCC 73106]